MLALAPGETRRLTAFALALLVSSGCGCAPEPVRVRAARLDGRYGTTAFTWLIDHEPSRVEVAGVPVGLISPFDPAARLDAAPADLRRACRRALAERALLLVFVPLRRPRLRAQALDCGFALLHDPGALVLAPR